MNVEAALRAVEGEVLELVLEVGLHLQAFQAQHLRVDRDRVIASSGGGRVADEFLEETAADPSPPLPVGIGLDAGEAVPLESGYRDGALNLAARLCGKAGPGEILASQNVVHLAGKVEGVRYADRGDLHLKGLAEAVRVVRVISEEGDPGPLGRSLLAFANLPPVDDEVVSYVTSSIRMEPNEYSSNRISVPLLLVPTRRYPKAQNSLPPAVASAWEVRLAPGLLDLVALGLACEGILPFPTARD